MVFIGLLEARISLGRRFLRDGDLWEVAQDLAICRHQVNPVRMSQRDEFTVMSRAIRSGNELKNRRAQIETWLDERLLGALRDQPEQARQSRCLMWQLFPCSGCYDVLSRVSLIAGANLPECSSK